MKPEKVIGKRIKAVRESRKMTQDALGTALGHWLKQAWPRQAVSGAERGERAFTGAELIALAHVLEINIGALLMPPMDAEDIEMPSGAMLPPSSLARVALDVETRNVLPDAYETIARIANWLDRHIGDSTGELRTLRDAYASMVLGAKPLPDDGLKAREAYNEEMSQRLDQHIADLYTPRASASSHVVDGLCVGMRSVNACKSSNCRSSHKM